MSLRGKVVLFLLLAIAALAAVTGGGAYFTSRNEKMRMLGMGILEALASLQRSRVAERSFLQSGEPKLAQQAQGLLADAGSRLNALKAASSNPEITKSLGAELKDLAAYRGVFAKVRGNVLQVVKWRSEMLAAGVELSAKVRTTLVEPLTQLEGELFMDTGEGLPALLSNLRTAGKELLSLQNRLILNVQGLYLVGNEKAYLAERALVAKARKLVLYNVAQTIEKVDKPELVAAWKALGKENKLLEAADAKLYTLWKENTADMASLDQTAASLHKQGDKLSNDARAQIEYWTRISDIMGLSVGAAAAGLLLLWGLYLIRSTFGPLRRAVDALHQVVGKVNASADGSRRSSQKLAEGASDQASSLEETSASLEEITSMTRKNAENAEAARNIMDEAQGLIERSGKSMGEMSTAMGEISGASEQISKIIKTIDEIAFQTNLLALNAAVEAARAGEAGAGFAVVADEVRNLAMRAAAAAQDTQGLIQNALDKVKRGVQLVGQTESEFGEMAQASDKNAQLVREIASASEEQRVGLEQIAKAVSQVDAVTQRNATEANETAEMSEQMLAQAEALAQVVLDLGKVLEGGSSDDYGGAKGAKKKKKKPSPKKREDQDETKLLTA